MKTRKLEFGILCLMVVSLIGLAVFDRPVKKHKPQTLGDLARADRNNADIVYKTPKAKASYESFIDRWKANPDKHVQDEVGAARIRLAFLSAHGKDYTTARKILKEAAADYKGTGIVGADFGGIKDQALYQAAVTFQAQGEKPKARQALVDFIRSQPTSPLVFAAYKRIVKMDGKSTPAVEDLLQHAVAVQEKHIRFETSVCGPKAAAYLLKLEGKGSFDYKTLAKDCGTTDAGTTIEGLRKGLRLHGSDYFGFKVGLTDLPHIQCPAILLTGDHYVVVTKVQGLVLTTFDPTRELESKVSLAKSPPDFSIVLLLKSAPVTEAN